METKCSYCKEEPKRGDIIRTVTDSGNVYHLGCFLKVNPNVAKSYPGVVETIYDPEPAQFKMACGRCMKPINGPIYTGFDGACYHKGCVVSPEDFNTPEVQLQTPEELIRGRDDLYSSKPCERFTLVAKLYDMWMEESGGADHATNHIVRMIFDKCTRIASSPEYVDSWEDIQGYCQCKLDEIQGD